ncbi:MAG: hypothetical protein HFF36_09375 [Coprobacillus sp.]|nr:hypothetical protein [Coprobacillus sp.]
MYEVLRNIDPNILEKEYKDVFVMLKVLQINDLNDTENKLYKDIVKFNNFQNLINEKTFVSNNSLFIHYQKELEKRDF